MNEIDNSLFFFNSRLTEEEKIKISIWYKNLSKQDKEYTDILIREAIDDEQFFSQGE